MDLKEQIAAACRILYVEGHADMNLGHVSGRPEGAETMWCKPGGLGFEETCADNLVELDLDGNKLSGATNPPGEWPLHAEIYRARADVNCVIHTHPLWTVVFGAVGQPFQVVNQDGVFFQRGFKTFSGTAELITTRQQGQELASQLGDGRAILMANHGVTLAAGSVAETLVAALNLEKALQVQLLTTICGGARNIVEPALAIGIADKLLANRKRTQDLWAYYVRKMERALTVQDSRS